jgi:hypothetical protein
MYRRPILCTLYGAVDFLKVLKIAVVGGGGVLLDGWEEVLGHNDVMYTSSMIELRRPGIKPGPPAWQAGTLPKELSRQLIL